MLDGVGSELNDDVVEKWVGSIRGDLRLSSIVGSFLGSGYFLHSPSECLNVKLYLSELKSSHVRL